MRVMLRLVFVSPHHLRRLKMPLLLVGTKKDASLEKKHL